MMPLGRRRRPPSPRDWFRDFDLHFAAVNPRLRRRNALDERAGAERQFDVGRKADCDGVRTADIGAQPIARLEQHLAANRRPTLASNRPQQHDPLHIADFADPPVVGERAGHIDLRRRIGRMHAAEIRPEHRCRDGHRDGRAAADRQSFSLFSIASGFCIHGMSRMETACACRERCGAGAAPSGGKDWADSNSPTILAFRPALLARIRRIRFRRLQFIRFAGNNQRALIPA